MAGKQLVLPGEIVKKSNALARARWSAESVWEPRLVALLASKVRADDTDFQVYEIPVSEVMRERESGGRDYREIESVVDKVMSRVLTIRDEKGKGWTKYNVFSRCRYRPEEGVLELGFHPDLRPHYLNLQKHFAQFNLMEYLVLPSIYSQRIFEILKSWADRPDVQIPLADLHEMLDTPVSLRNNFKDFRRRVLDKAHADICDKTSLRFEWEPVKRGKAVTYVLFIFDVKRRIEMQKKKGEEERSKQSKAAVALIREATACALAKDFVCVKRSNKARVCKACEKFEFCTPSTKRAHENAITQGLIKEKPAAQA